MKQVLFSFWLLLTTLPALAQIAETSALRIYRVNDQITTADAQGNITGIYPYGDVSVKPDGTLIKVSVKGAGALYYPPSLFLTDQGAPYGATVNATMIAWRGAIPSGATLQAGSISVSASTTATFGTAPPISTDYTTTSTITTTNSIRVLLENIGSGTASFTYAGLSYALLAGEQRNFTADLDPTTGKLVPFAALSVNGTASTIRVTLIPKQ